MFLRLHLLLAVLLPSVVVSFVDPGVGTKSVSYQEDNVIEEESTYEEEEDVQQDLQIVTNIETKIDIDDDEKEPPYNLDIPISAPEPLKICLLVEPSPFTYICGYANRFNYMLKNLQRMGDIVEAVTAEVHVEKPTSAWGYPVHHTLGMKCPTYAGVSLSKDWTWKALRVVRKMNPDLVHAASPGFLCWNAAFYCRLLQIPLVMSYHTHIPIYTRSYFPKFWGFFIEKMIWMWIRVIHGMADLTLVTSPQIKAEFEAHGVKRVEVWQKGVDCNVFHPRHRNLETRRRITNGNPDDFVLIFVSRLASEKRIKDIRPILDELLKKDPNYRLVIVGTGPEEEELINETFKDHPNVHFTGLLLGDELSEAYASADCFVMPSDSETLGFVVMESMASCVPVIGANAGGIPSMINDGETSYLVEPGDTAGFIEKIEFLKANRNFRLQMGQKARKVVEGWKWETSMNTMRHIQYKRAIENYERRWGVKLRRFITRPFRRKKLKIQHKFAKLA